MIDFSAHTTPYVLTSYAVSTIVIAALIVWRIRELRKAENAEKQLRANDD